MSTRTINKLKTEIEKRGKEIERLTALAYERQQIINEQAQQIAILEEKLAMTETSASEEIAKLTKERNLYKEGLVASDKDCDDSRERIATLEEKLVAVETSASKEIAKLKAEIEKIKGEAEAWEKSFNIEWERLERLTVLVNDNERAEKVVTCCGDLFGVAFVNRNYGINDYRAMLKEEMGK